MLSTVVAPASLPKRVDSPCAFNIAQFLVHISNPSVYWHSYVSRTLYKNPPIGESCVGKKFNYNDATCHTRVKGLTLLRGKRKKSPV